MPDDARYFLAPDKKSGYGVTSTGTGIGVFSTEKGRGKGILDHMLHPEGGGAAWFDHFDGHLNTLYEPREMKEFGRVPNWTPGGPDVVFRVHEGNAKRFPNNPYEEDYGVKYPGTLGKEASTPRAPGQMHGVPWADEDDRDAMINEARGV